MAARGLKLWGVWDFTDTLIEILTLEKLAWFSEDLGMTDSQLQSIINLRADKMHVVKLHTFRRVTEKEANNFK